MVTRCIWGNVLSHGRQSAGDVVNLVDGNRFSWCNDRKPGCGAPPGARGHHDNLPARRIRRAASSKIAPTAPPAVHFTQTGVGRSDVRPSGSM